MSRREYRINKSTTVVGALLGTQSGREVSITNSFEIALMDAGDVDMDTEGKTNAFNVDTDFLETRREQCTSSLTSVSSHLPDVCRRI